MSEKWREILTREKVLGVVCMIIGLIIIAVAALSVESGEVATFFDEKIGTLFAPPSQATLYALGTLCFFVGGWQLYRGFRSIGVLLGAAGFLMVASFLITLTSGKERNSSTDRSERNTEEDRERVNERLELGCEYHVYE